MTVDLQSTPLPLRTNSPKLAMVGGFEPPTDSLEGCSSILLSYTITCRVRLRRGLPPPYAFRRTAPWLQFGNRGCTTLASSVISAFSMTGYTRSRMLSQKAINQWLLRGRDVTGKGADQKDLTLLIHLVNHTSALACYASPFPNTQTGTLCGRFFDGGRLIPRGVWLLRPLPSSDHRLHLL